MRHKQNRPLTNECPLGPALQKYWDRLSAIERKMKLDAEALYSLVIQESAVATALKTPGNHIIDPFCGAGGTAIGYARAGKTVTAIELDPVRLEMAKYNAALFGVADKIEFIQGDALEIWPRVSADVVFLSPPWGGPSYSKMELFTLDHFVPSGHKLLTLADRLKMNVVMQLPRNFDFNEFKKFSWDVAISEDRVEGHLLSYTAVLSRQSKNLSEGPFHP